MADQRQSINNANLGLRVAGQDIYEESSTAKCAIGSRIQLGNRVFYYALNGATALASGKLVQSQAIDTYDEDIVLPTSTVAGVKSITLTNHASASAKVADQFAGGLLVVGAGATGIGDSYRIKSNTAAAAGASMTVTLYDETVRAYTAGTHTFCIVVCSQYKTVVDAGTGMLAGVPLIAVTAGYYFWAQTWGPCGVVSGGAITKGKDVLANGDGTVIVDDAATAKPRVGIAMNTYDSGDAGPVFLQSNAPRPGPRHISSRRPSRPRPASDGWPIRDSCWNKS